MPQPRATTFRHDPREPMSYFVKIETPRGDRTIWGVDLERAVRGSLTQSKAGDEVGLRAVRQEAVTARARAGHGRPGCRLERSRGAPESLDRGEACVLR